MNTLFFIFFSPQVWPSRIPPQVLHHSPLQIFCSLKASDAGCLKNLPKPSGELSEMQKFKTQSDMFLWQCTFFSLQATSLIPQVRNWVMQGMRIIWPAYPTQTLHHVPKPGWWVYGSPDHVDHLQHASSPQRLWILKRILLSLATQKLNPSATTSGCSTDVLRANSFQNRCDLLGGGVSTRFMFAGEVLDPAKTQGGDLSVEMLDVQAPSLFSTVPN